MNWSVLHSKHQGTKHHGGPGCSQIRFKSYLEKKKCLWTLSSKGLLICKHDIVTCIYTLIPRMIWWDMSHIFSNLISRLEVSNIQSLSKGAENEKSVFLCRTNAGAIWGLTRRKLVSELGKSGQDCARPPAWGFMLVSDSLNGTFHCVIASAFCQEWKVCNKSGQKWVRGKWSQRGEKNCRQLYSKWAAASWWEWLALSTQNYRRACQLCLWRDTATEDSEFYGLLDQIVFGLGWGSWASNDIPPPLTLILPTGG